MLNTREILASNLKKADSTTRKKIARLKLSPTLRKLDGVPMFLFLIDFPARQTTLLTTSTVTGTS
jgi:hypothetical protein